LDHRGKRAAPRSRALGELTSLNFAIGFAPGHPSELSESCRAAEDLGFQKIGIVDSPSIYRDVYVSCASALQVTSRVALGPRVTNPLTRHITSTASALLTLNELAPGRVFAGVGTGDSSVANIGMRPAKVSILGEFVSDLRKLLQGETVDHQGVTLNLNWGKSNLPIYIAAHGPKALELAGAVADGVIVGTGVGKEIVEDALETISRGTSQAGRSLHSADVWWHLGVNIAGSRDEAIAGIRFNLASKVNHLMRFRQHDKHTPVEYLDALARIHRDYNYLEHLRPDGSGVNARLVRESGLEDYLADRYAIVGTPDECLSRLEQLIDWGISKVWLNIYSDDKIAFMEKWSKEISAKLSTKAPPTSPMNASEPSSES
jgi:5,10-methylenetetrahydromethanopterin reductase